MLKKTKLALTAILMGAAIPVPTAAQDTGDPYFECLKEYCSVWAQQGDWDKYELCRQWCAEQTGGPYFAPPSFSEPVAKLD